MLEEKKPKNREFAASTNIYFRPTDLEWLHRHAAFLTRTASRRVRMSEIVREAVMQYRKQHENET